MATITIIIFAEKLSASRLDPVGMDVINQLSTDSLLCIYFPTVSPFVFFHPLFHSGFWQLPTKK